MSTESSVKAQPKTAENEFPVRSGAEKKERKLGPVKDLNRQSQSLSNTPQLVQRKLDTGKSDKTVENTSPIVQEVLRSPGQPLDTQTRAFLEKRFGHDFSRVRVHSDERAVESSRAINALAYTAGNNVVLGARQYAPNLPISRALLAHELAHTIQQVPIETDSQGAPALIVNSNAAEKAADEAAHLATRTSLETPSAALRIRDSLRQTQIGGGMVQRAVKTWAGEYDTDKYNTVKDGAGNEIGVDIKLRFKPGDPVDATMIGMVQMVTSRDKGAVIAVSPTVATRSIPAGKAGEGAHIDRLAKYPNPLYATGDGGAGKALWSAPTEKFWGQHGYRHVDKAGTIHKKDAILIDRPQLPGHGANASQIFETTALAVTGEQTGAYYGSVSWGWRSDAAGKFSKLALTKVRDDVPSGTFARAQRLWNVSKTSAGAPVIKFWMASARYVNTDKSPVVQNPADAAGSEIGKLDKNVRLEVIDKGRTRDFNKVDPKVQWWKVTPVEGTFIGRVGWIMASLLSNTKT